jgi:hypothetical protein
MTGRRALISQGGHRSGGGNELPIRGRLKTVHTSSHVEQIDLPAVSALRYISGVIELLSRVSEPLERILGPPFGKMSMGERAQRNRPTSTME